MSPKAEPSPDSLSVLGLIAAVDVYRATLQMLGEDPAPEQRRELLILWRSCQERLDHLLDVLPESQAGPLRLLRQEIEDGLLDDPPSLPALADALDALTHICATLLYRWPEPPRGSGGHGIPGRGGSHAPGL